MTEIAAAVSAAVSDADYVCITGFFDSGPRTFTSTDALDALHDRFQQGPCRALGEQSVVLVSDTAVDARWPQFTAAAAELGIRSMLAMELSCGDDLLGALSLYAFAASAFTVDDRAIAAVFADRGANVLAGESAHGLRRLPGEAGRGSASATRTRSGRSLAVSTVPAPSKSALPETALPETVRFSAVAEIVVCDAGDPLVVAVGGDLDAASSPAFTRALAELPARDTVLDLRRVRFCGAAGLQALVDFGSRLRAAGAALQLGIAPPLGGVLRRLSLTEDLPVAGSVDEAVQALRRRRYSRR